MTTNNVKCGMGNEGSLRELTDSTIAKLSAMSDEDFAKLELYPDFDE